MVKTGTKKRLSHNQRRALDALMLSNTVQEAAGKCELSMTTLNRYLRQDVFRAELAKREGAIIDEASRVLIRGQLKALSVLDDLMSNSENESIQRLAAKDWLEFSMRLRELKTIEARLCALEEKIL